MPDSASPESADAGGTASGRVLACIQCQQRKVKCDRKFPCARCVKGGISCVPGTAVGKQRKKRFAERDLLERLRRYERLMTEHNVAFEPMHSGGSEQRQLPPVRQSDSLTKESPSESQAESPFATRDLWTAINTVARPEYSDDDAEDYDSEDNGLSFPAEDVRDSIFYQIWDFTTSQDLLFGLGNSSSVELATLHPNQLQRFQLWQLYLDNVNPLLKVSHAPTLQTRLIQSTASLTTIKPELEALLFSIYCIALTTIDEDTCMASFSTPKADMLRIYRFACQQALFNCNYMRTSDMDCLTALFLYLLSVREHADPRAMASHLGATIRIAQRMRLDNESHLSKLTPFAAEMRRRLWWAIVIFDQRIAEMTGGKNSILAPIWDCLPVHNLNDVDLHQEAKTLPASAADSNTTTETLFCVLKSKVANFTRFTISYINFATPVWKEIAKATSHGLVETMDGVVAFGDMIEEKYLSKCNPDIPLQFYTLWHTRASLGRLRIMSYFNLLWHSTPEDMPLHHRDLAFRSAILALQADTKLLTAPSVKHFSWLSDFHFLFLAYVLIVQELRRRPTHAFAEEAWEVFLADVEARWLAKGSGTVIFLRIFSKALSKAWDAREAVARKQGVTLTRPNIIIETINYYQSSSGARSSASNTPAPDAGDMDMDQMFGPGGMFDMSGADKIPPPTLFTDTLGAGMYDDTVLNQMAAEGLFDTQTW